MQIRPQAGPQELFLSSSADVVFYGGSAGGGKTWALLVEPLRHIMDVPNFGAVFFRRTTKQITAEGGPWDESVDLYGHFDARNRGGYLDWTFEPHGNRVSFAHMEHEKNRYDWKSSQIALLLFDQLEDFTRKMFLYMLSRNRSTCGVRPYIRCEYNPVTPDDAVGGWIHEFVSWYLDKNQEYPDPSKAGVIRYFLNVRDQLHWYDDRETAVSAAAGFGFEEPQLAPKSFTFIPASVFDNKVLLAKDPGYLANLYGLDHIDQERLLKANHKIKPEAGKVINRAWFRIEERPIQAQNVVRFWDFAATERKMLTGAATASVKICQDVHGHYGILDMTEDWIGAAAVDEHAASIANQDGAGVKQRWEEEGGSSGKRTTSALAAKMPGLDCAGIRPSGDKLARLRPFAAQVKAGNVWLLRADWNDRFLSIMHNTPDGLWDVRDATSGGFGELVDKKKRAWARGA